MHDQPVQYGQPQPVASAPPMSQVQPVQSYPMAPQPQHNQPQGFQPGQGQPQGFYPGSPPPQQHQHMQHQQPQQHMMAQQQGGFPHRGYQGQVLPPQVNNWAYGMCDCCQDTGLCCEVFWCYPCVQSRLHDAIDASRNDSFNWLVCCGLVLGFAFIGNFACCLHGWYLRSEGRKRWGIRGDPCADCCMACCCLDCLLCQLFRETRAHGIDPGVSCCVATTPVAPVGAPGMGHPHQCVVQPGHLGY